jgi:hypothetical protein
LTKRTGKPGTVQKRTLVRTALSVMRAKTIAKPHLDLVMPAIVKRTVSQAGPQTVNATD